MNDLFGESIVEQPKQRQNGYAAPPGTGPHGETCRSCKHYRSVRYHDKTYPKCWLMVKAWTHGYGSDIRASSPACRWWTFPESTHETVDIARPKTAWR